MTAPLLATRDAMVTVLDSHRLTTPVQCACGWPATDGNAGTHAEHVVDAFAGILRDSACLALDVNAVKAEALREAADKWTQGAWGDTPRRADRIADRIAAAQYVGDWLRARAAALAEDPS